MFAHLQEFSSPTSTVVAIVASVSYVLYPGNWRVISDAVKDK
jgi:hypothetical protein